MKSGSQGSAACGGQDKEKEEGEGLEDQILHIQMKEVPSGEDSDGKLTVNCYQRCELGYCDYDVFRENDRGARIYR